MKIKKLLLFFIALCFLSGCFMTPGFTFFDKKKTKIESIQKYDQEKNDVWCVTFQLVWNEFMDKMFNGEPINFVDGNPKIADELNKKSYTKDDISENSYYIESGKISKKLKKQIEKAIYEKFKEKSDILDFVDWSARDSYLFYSILKKDFNFYAAFDKLKPAPFNDSKEKVKYFGIENKSNQALYKNLEVLFYNSAEDYAVKLLTKENEEVILYRTILDKSFEEYYTYITENTNPTNFTKKDVLIIPEIAVDKTISYDSLCGKKIVGSNYIISQALQTIKFKMDNKGGSLKSEAALAIMKTALLPEEDSPKFLLFDKPFVMFLKEQGKEKPYYAMKIENTDYLVKEK